MYSRILNLSTEKRIALALVASLLVLAAALHIPGNSYSGLVEMLLNNVQYLALGLTGAIFANSTGAGGGVIFIPVFHQLGLTEIQSVATSFGIQCFGMTAGALTWYRYFRAQKRQSADWQPLSTVIKITAPASVAGLWLVIAMGIKAPASLHGAFGAFSIILGAIILASAAMVNSTSSNSALNRADCFMLALIGFSGGIITAWLSVGVGEILAIYLILRRFDLTMSIASAVIVTAMTVWSAAVEFLWLNPQARMNLVLFAGCGAVIGGVLAKQVIAQFSAKWLKVGFGAWILLVGIFG